MPKTHASTNKLLRALNSKSQDPIVLSFIILCIKKRRGREYEISNLLTAVVYNIILDCHNREMELLIDISALLEQIA